MFNLKQYNMKGVPDGYPQFFFERGTFNTNRNHAFDNDPSTKAWPPAPKGDADCKSFENEVYGPYEYMQLIKDKATDKVLSPVKDGTGKFKKADGLAGTSYFNDDKIRCRQLNFAEIYKKDATVGYVNKTIHNDLKSDGSHFSSFTGHDLPKGNLQ